MLPLLLLLLAAAIAPAQVLRVYSEFSRIGPHGEIVDLDRGGSPREILSPAIPRNAWSTFQIVVNLPAGKRYTLHVGQNPTDAVRVRIYRPVQQQFGNRTLPDRLEPVALPVEGRSEGPAVYWMDLWADATAPVQRIKVEPEVLADGDWITYPMEVRIAEAVAPESGRLMVNPPPPDKPSDTAALALLRTRLCDSRNMGKPALTEPKTVRDLILRNVSQDIALTPSPEALWRVTGATDRRAWCAAVPTPRPPGAQGPEWYLRARDRLVQGR